VGRSAETDQWIKDFFKPPGYQFDTSIFLRRVYMDSLKLDRQGFVLGTVGRSSAELSLAEVRPRLNKPTCRRTAIASDLKLAVNGS
jgi:hypothetical protein